jgi:hypothetical protein
MEIQAQDLLNAITDQRNRAFDNAAELTAANLALQREITNLKAEIEALKAAEPAPESAE